MATRPSDAVLAFQAQLDKAMKAWYVDRDRILRGVQGSLQAYRDRVVAGFAGQTAWDAARVAQITQANGAALAQVDALLTRQLIEAANRATTYALMGVEDPLSAIGLPIRSMSAASPLRELAILQDYIPSLIKGVTSDVHNQVQSLMQRAALGGLDTRDMVKQVGDLVGPLKPGERGPGTIFSKAEIRARDIVRTEVNRVHSLTTKQRIGELAEKFPGVGKEWIHRPSNFPRPSHLALHGKIVYPAKGEKFELGGVKIDGPHDPKLDVKDLVNCHCGIRVTYNSQLGAQSAKDSAYIPGDGTSIPSAKGRRKSPGKAAA